MLAIKGASMLRWWRIKHSKKQAFNSSTDHGGGKTARGFS